MDDITLELPSSGGALSTTAINSAITDIYEETNPDGCGIQNMYSIFYDFEK